MTKIFTVQYKQQNSRNMLTNKSRKSFNLILFTSAHFQFRFWGWGYSRQPPTLERVSGMTRLSFVVWPHTHIYIIHIILCKKSVFFKFRLWWGQPDTTTTSVVCACTKVLYSSFNATTPHSWSPNTDYRTTPSSLASQLNVSPHFHPP